MVVVSHLKTGKCINNVEKSWDVLYQLPSLFEMLCWDKCQLLKQNLIWGRFLLFVYDLQGIQASEKKIGGPWDVNGGPQ